MCNLQMFQDLIKLVVKEDVEQENIKKVLVLKLDVDVKILLHIKVVKNIIDVDIVNLEIPEDVKENLIHTKKNINYLAII